jgi:hypothetical protein
MGQLVILSGSGDDKLIWDPKDGRQTAIAERRFRELRQAGHLAYKVDKRDGSRGEQLLDFDPNEEEIILSPPMAGG